MISRVSRSVDCGTHHFIHLSVPGVLGVELFTNVLHLVPRAGNQPDHILVACFKDGTVHIFVAFQRLLVGARALAPQPEA